MVEEHLARSILETIAKVGGFEEQAGRGIAFQVDIEDAVGISHQIQILSEKVQEEI